MFGSLCLNPVAILYFRVVVSVFVLCDRVSCFVKGGDGNL